MYWHDRAIAELRREKKSCGARAKRRSYNQRAPRTEPKLDKLFRASISHALFNHRSLENERERERKSMTRGKNPALTVHSHWAHADRSIFGILARRLAAYKWSFSLCAYVYDDECHCSIRSERERECLKKERGKYFDVRMKDIEVNLRLSKIFCMGCTTVSVNLSFLPRKIKTLFVILSLNYAQNKSASVTIKLVRRLSQIAPIDASIIGWMKSSTQNYRPRSAIS